MAVYKAHISHSESTLKALIKYQDKICHPLLNYVGGTGCVILVILAILMEPYIGKINTAIFSFLGCWLFVTNRYRPKQLYDNIMRNFGGLFPKMHYKFTDNSIEIERSGKKQAIKYEDISNLSESSKYCFFVYQKKAAFMFEKNSADDISNLMNLLSSKTKLSWKKTSKKLKAKHKTYGGNKKC